ncbi:hypothetical protein [Rhizobium paknamense]|uniref:Uncharacterized protein n=1 Tax=Rhizobium paknamense TaxID=1206817 RepID=A0ABU0IKL1_9HYPH|nr:hypothetical protein [Rhizobium paknamense]MDQ0458197.1 hypothetical protein [Rhizobium paknamense]
MAIIEENRSYLQAWVVERNARTTVKFWALFNIQTFTEQFHVPDGEQKQLQTGSMFETTAGSKSASQTTVGPVTEVSPGRRKEQI